MTHAALAPRIGRQFDPFLFAAIGEDRHGQLLSVISALARSGLDPWEEALGLARMSREVAASRLSRLIAALPGEPTSDRSPDAISAELIALLPPRGEPYAPSSIPSAAPFALVPPKARVGIAIGALVLIIAMSLLFPAITPSGSRSITNPETHIVDGASKSISGPDHRP